MYKPIPYSVTRVYAVSPGNVERQIFSDDGMGCISVSWGNIANRDVTPPTLSMPGTMTVNATSPQGATVNYTVTASDPDNAAADLTISCTPPSGSTFASGATTVNCQAADPAHNATTGSFAINVNGAGAQTTALTATVGSFNLPKGTQTSLDAKLKSIQQALNANDTATACSSLTAFMNQVKAQSGKALTASQAAALLDAARQIQAVVGC
jgi:hypothetical protein